MNATWYILGTSNRTAYITWRKTRIRQTTAQSIIVQYSQECQQHLAHALCKSPIAHIYSPALLDRHHQGDIQLHVRPDRYIFQFADHLKMIPVKSRLLRKCRMNLVTFQYVWSTFRVGGNLQLQSPQHAADLLCCISKRAVATAVSFTLRTQYGLLLFLSIVISCVMGRRKYVCYRAATSQLAPSAYESNFTTTNAKPPLAEQGLTTCLGHIQCMIQIQ